MDKPGPTVTRYSLVAEMELLDEKEMHSCPVANGSVREELKSGKEDGYIGGEPARRRAGHGIICSVTGDYT